MTKKDFEIKLDESLQVRAVALLVQVASQFDSEVYVENGPKKINAKSIMGVMTIGLNNGETLTVTANGADEEQAVEKIGRFLNGELV